MLKNTIPIDELISNLPLFKELDPHVMERLVRGITVIAAPKGTVLVRRGDACTGLHIVVSGQVKLCLQALRGNEKVIGLLGLGESFGESAMFLDQPYRHTAEALLDSRLVHVSKATVLAGIERDPRFAYRVIARLSQRLSHFINEVETFTLRSGPQRVVTYLLKELGAQSRPEESAITLPAQKGVIASQLNLTQEHFSRILHGLAAEGLIEVRGRTVRILNAQTLSSQAVS